MTGNNKSQYDALSILQVLLFVLQDPELFDFLGFVGFGILFILLGFLDFISICKLR